MQYHRRILVVCGNIKELSFRIFSLASTNLIIALIQYFIKSILITIQLFYFSMKCERCKAMYNDKPYRSSNSTATYNCRKCNCNKHSDRCHYARRLDEFPNEHLRGSGGVCHNCLHHTTGDD